MHGIHVLALVVMSLSSADSNGNVDGKAAAWLAEDDAKYAHYGVDLAFKKAVHGMHYRHCRGALHEQTPHPDASLFKQNPYKTHSTGLD